MKKLAAFWRQKDGTAAIEFGMIVVPLFVVVFGALQLFLISLTQQMLETAVETSGRTVLTGQADGATIATFRTSICKALPAILDCNSVMIDMRTVTSFDAADTSTPTITYDKDGKVTNQWQFQTGGPSSIIVLKLMYQWPVFNLLNFNLTNLSNNSGRLLIATSVFRNEAYK